MKIKNMKLATWLTLSFTVILSFVVLLGVVSYIQSSQLHEGVVTLYSHPFEVRRAIDDLKNEISEIQIETRNLILFTDEAKQQESIQSVALLSSKIEENFDILGRRYLGPSSNVVDAYEAYLIWDLLRDANYDLILSGDLIEAIESIGDDGAQGNQIIILLEKIEVIDTFAQNKANQLYNDSINLYAAMTTQLITISIAIFLLTLVIGIGLFISVRDPLLSMNSTVNAFRNGDRSNRISYNSDNEFGILAKSINEFAKVIESNEKLYSRIMEISSVLIRENEVHSFFRVTLEALAKNTNAQIAAAYLLNENKTEYIHFESIGINANAKKSFIANDLEGEFGSAILSHKPQYIKNIVNTRFIFNTVNGQYTPNEMMTIPILSNNEVIALISLATIQNFDELAISLIKSAIVPISSRIESILADVKIKEFMTELESQSAELLEQNAELEMQKKQLDESSKLKSNFLANMSHELRTPLNSVIGLSDILYRKLENKISSEDYGYLEIIGRNGKNLLSLINNILDISRIESGVEEFEIEKFNVNSLIEDIIKLIESQATQKGIVIKHPTKDVELHANSDLDKCRHVIQNLINNAVKFTNTGSVTVSARQSDYYIEISVIDTGIGIESKNLKKIFEEFRQADGGTTRKFGGTGLGLSIAMKYANLLGGTITVESAIGIGSTFKFVLPISNNRATGLESKNEFEEVNYKYVANSLRQTNDPSDKVILLVEDNESAIIQIKDLVVGMGAQIIVAHNGIEALKIVDQTIPDAIILDLMMPEMDGFEVLNSIRSTEETSLIPVLILTAKQITKEELSYLRKNNIHQLIQKGEVDRIKLQTSIFNMLYSKKIDGKRTIVDKKFDEKEISILVVEDNPDNMITMKALLSDYKNIIEAIDGYEGINFAAKYKPELILMDIALPGISGIEAFIEIRNNPELNHIPIIAVTASALESEKKSILEHGFNALIPKPIVKDDLFRIIKEVLDE